MLFLIKAITGMMLIIPLIALAFVSIARIGILRMVIAFSPLLVLNEVFKGKGISGEAAKKLESNWLDMAYTSDPESLSSILKSAGAELLVDLESELKIDKESL